MIVVALMSLIQGFSLADRWGSPPGHYESPDGNWSLLCDDLTGFQRPNLTLRHKEGENWVTCWSAQSPQSRSPYQVFFSRGGTVALVDEWARLGEGVSVAILSRTGKCLSALTLDQVWPNWEQHFGIELSDSISSVWWHQRGTFGFLSNSHVFAFQSPLGYVFGIDTTSGRILKVTTRLRHSIHQYVLEQALKDLKSSDQDKRCLASWLLGGCSDLSVVPTLVSLGNVPNLVGG